MLGVRVPPPLPRSGRRGRGEDNDGVGFQLYKSGQGRYLRGGTGIAAALVDIVLCYYIWTLLDRYLAENVYKSYLKYGIPAVTFAVLCAVVFFYMNKPNIVDFLVATETEMKKVAWSSRAELVGSTAVVIATVFALAVFIYFADTIFIYVFKNGLGLW
jgi:preprotein translocase subunit SecE